MAKHPTKLKPEGTTLIAYIMPQYHKHPEPNKYWSVFPSEEEKKFKENLFAERKSQTIKISFAESAATVILSDGSEIKSELPFFQQPYNIPSGKYYSIWGPDVTISPERLENFTVKLPALYINGEEFIIPPIEFKISETKYAPVFNC